MKVAVLSDTHTSGMTRTMPMSVWPYLESADHVLHAGDVCDPAVLDEIEAVAPLTAVLGNCDGWDLRVRGVAEESVLTLGDVRIGMVHDAGPKQGRWERMRERFPTVRAVVFGHSHIPWNEDRDGLLLFNPGSPTWRRQAPFTSMGLLWIDGDSIEGEIFPV